VTDLDRFNALPEVEARERLAECLDIPRWVDTVLEGRPYADRDALMKVAEVAAGTMSDEELESALDHHPRIGERGAGGHDEEHSSREQAGVATERAETVSQLREIALLRLEQVL
jgi:2-oxo-4-hydroxy-4-carboxy-5-ureidoimidazoline decarboxylase